ncbi:MAG: Flp pilus assembly protein CpaB [Chloroflexota bacterium]
MNGRVLILIGVVLLLVGVVGFVLLGGGLGGDSTGPAQQPTANAQASGQQQQAQAATPLPTPTPIELVNLVIAVQELPRGFRIPANAVAVRPWPADSAPFNGITNVDDVVGKIARTDIFREQPILSNMLVDDFENLANDLGRVGSDAAAILPNNLVAIAMPVDRLTSVAYAIQDGDRVDVIVSMLFVDVDEQFQSIAPNVLTLLIRDEDGIQLADSVPGRPSQTSLGEVIIEPSERQRPRLLTQRTIQDALVVHTGEFPIDGRFIGIPPTPTPVPDTGEEDTDEGPPPPTPVPPRPDIVTLGVTPQDAVLLAWAVEARLPLTLALRSATDNSQVQTEPVTLDFFMSEYSITLPGRRDYTIEPALRSIRQLDLNSATLALDTGGGGDGGS